MLRILSSILMCVMMCACERREELAPPDQSYVVRARIVEMPRSDAFLQLHHAAIPEFQDRNGKVVGMKEMVMEFPGLSSEVETGMTNFASGDAVEVSFEVRWTTDPRLLVTKMTKLPHEADLGLKKTLEPK
ncbi:MAG: hypothetical protein ACK5SZ_00800 [bacterium]